MSDTTVSPALALLTRLHKATRDLDALQWHGEIEYHRVRATTDDISTIADELAGVLDLSIEDAWAPVLAGH